MQVDAHGLKPTSLSTGSACPESGPVARSPDRIVADDVHAPAEAAVLLEGVQGLGLGQGGQATQGGQKEQQQFHVLYDGSADGCSGLLCDLLRPQERRGVWAAFRIARVASGCDT